MLEPCPRFNFIEDGTGKGVMLWAVDTVAKGNECAARHAALVKSLK
ncbi:hypothetical protein [Acinetobacter sp. 2JN-4]|nr:hypothetical protein [Acinetobacter sp. 2JN-4]